MVENTSKMMLRASKIDQGMAKIITQKIERILKNFSFFGFCKLDFATLDFCTGASKHPTSGEALCCYLTYCYGMNTRLPSLM